LMMIISYSVVFGGVALASKEHWSNDFLGSPLGLCFAELPLPPPPNCSHCVSQLLKLSKFQFQCGSLSPQACTVQTYHPSIGTAILWDRATSVSFLSMWTRATMWSFQSLGHFQARNMHAASKYLVAPYIFFLVLPLLSYFNYLTQPRLLF
jgi:hypothetical protein